MNNSFLLDNYSFKIKKKAQVSIEFILLLILGVFFILTFMVVVSNLSDEKLQNKGLMELDDLGKSLQQELLLASRLENGYSREIYVPERLYSDNFDINLSVASDTIMYLNLNYFDTEIFYPVPYIQGNITHGYNTISKHDDTIYVTQ